MSRRFQPFQGPLASGGLLDDLAKGPKLLYPPEDLGRSSKSPVCKGESYEMLPICKGKCFSNLVFLASVRV